MKIGFFLHFDFTTKGILFNEIKCYNTLFDNPNIEEIYIFDYKGKYGHMCKDFEFKYTKINVNGLEDIEKFKLVDVLFMWDLYQDFFGGIVSTKAIELYKMMSHITNEHQTPVYFRICDSKVKVRDYKDLIRYRINECDSGPKFAEKNKEYIHLLDDVKNIDYEKIHFLCNGSRSVYDWAWITLTKTMPFLKKEDIQSRTYYISDDILFRYSESYENNSHLNKDIKKKKNRLYHVGNLIPAKVTRIKEVIEDCKIPLFLRTDKRKINGGLKKIPTIEMVEIPIIRDAMYKELNEYVAYLFVGKGDRTSYYFNKTLYDASIGRTVFLIYNKIDKENIYHELSDYVFSNSKELEEKFEWIKEDYEKHLEFQRKVLIDNLSTETLEIFEKNVETF